jgi:membrane-associated phospholipid phosphatase
MKIAASIYKCKWYFSGLIILLLISFCLLIIYGKTASFFLLNQWHPAFFNEFFIRYTFIGDGIFAVCLTVLAFFYYKNRQRGMALLCSFIISGLAAQMLKKIFPSPRPKLFFKPGDYQHFIDGVTLSGNTSFPSGHTATAFALAVVMVVMMKEKKWQLLILLAALLVGYSRIYLGQHFLLDVMIGAVIGSLSGILSVYLAVNSKAIRRSVRKIHRISNKDTVSSPSMQSA